MTNMIGAPSLRDPMLGPESTTAATDIVQLINTVLQNLLEYPDTNSIILSDTAVSHPEHNVVF